MTEERNEESSFITYVFFCKNSSLGLEGLCGQ